MDTFSDMVYTAAGDAIVAFLGSLARRGTSLVATGAGANDALFAAGALAGEEKNRRFLLPFDRC